MATAAKKPKFDAFTWEGVDKQGKKVKGEMEAASTAFVNATLRRQGINPVKVQKRSKSLFQFKQKIRTKDVAIFTRQLATMIVAGIPVAQAFDIVGKGHENPSMRELIMSVKQDIESGTNMTQALGKHRDFALQVCEIPLGHLPLLRDDDHAPAVGAALLAERQVRIERQRLVHLRRRVLEPRLIRRTVERGVELDCGGVRGVARAGAIVLPE